MGGSQGEFEELWGTLFWGYPTDRIFKKMSKTDLPFRFCKIELRNTLFIFGRKNGRLFLLFDAIHPILTYFLFEALVALKGHIGAQIKSLLVAITKLRD